MEIRENITLYICSFCHKKLIRKHAMIWHENFCSMNPKNQPICLWSGGKCKHLEIKDHLYKLKRPNEDGDYSFTNKYFCKCEQKHIHTYLAEKKGLLKKYPELFIESELMPSRCPFYKSEIMENFYDKNISRK